LAVAVQHVAAVKRISAPRERVWAVYTDHESWSDWAGIGRARLSRLGREDRDGVGCVRVIGSGALAAHEEITEFDAPRYMAYRVVRGGLPMRRHFGEVELHDRGATTEIEWRCRFESRIPLFGPPMRWIVMAVFRRVLSNLKHEIESAEKWP
jgi:uncharacterized protein YndB with AHSA1/START domain